MAVDPAVFEVESSDDILARAKEPLAALGHDVSEPNLAHQALAPFARELQDLQIRVVGLVAQAFLATATGASLDLHGQAMGRDRKPALFAEGVVRVSGAAGTVVPAGTLVATAAGADHPAQSYATTADAVVPAAGYADVPVVATVAGAASNVEAGLVVLPTPAIPGVTAVTNPDPIRGGADVESDDAYRARLLFVAAHPRSSGNADDYVVWAMDVAGVGAVAVAGADAWATSRIVCYLVGADGLPATPELVDRVQLAVAPPWVTTVEAELLAVANAAGRSVVSRADAQGGAAVRFAYAAGGPGEVYHDRLDLVLPRPGVWELRALVAVSGSTGAADTLRVEVFNDTTGLVAATGVDGTGQARVDVAPAEQTALFAAAVTDFYFNGTDHLRARALRLVADAAAVQDVDCFVYRSAFSKDDGSGLAPIMHRVEFRAARQVDVEVAATIRVLPGFAKLVVRNAVAAGVAAYVTRKALDMVTKTITWAEIARIIVETPGVYVYETLTVNGVEHGDVQIATDEVPVLVSFVTTTWDQMDALGLTWDQWDALNRTWNTITEGVGG